MDGGPQGALVSAGEDVDVAGVGGGESVRASAVEFTVKMVAAWAGAAVIMLAAIIAANSRPAASALVFLHTDASLLVRMVIFPCSFLPLLFGRLALYV